MLYRLQCSIVFFRLQVFFRLGHRDDTRRRRGETFHLGITPRRIGHGVDAERSEQRVDGSEHDIGLQRLAVTHLLRTVIDEAAHGDKFGRGQRWLQARLQQLDLEVGRGAGGVVRAEGLEQNVDEAGIGHLGLEVAGGHIVQHALDLAVDDGAGWRVAQRAEQLQQLAHAAGIKHLRSVQTRRHKGLLPVHGPVQDVPCPLIFLGPTLQGVHSFAQSVACVVLVNKGLQDIVTTACHIIDGESVTGKVCRLTVVQKY